MGECNRSYVAPRLGALLGSQIRLTEVQIEPAVNYDKPAHYTYLTTERKRIAREGANKRGNSSRLTQSFHFFMFEPIFSPVNALNQPI